MALTGGGLGGALGGASLELGVGPEALPWVGPCFRSAASRRLADGSVGLGDGCERPGLLGETALALAALLNFSFVTQRSGDKFAPEGQRFRFARLPVRDAAFEEGLDLSVPFGYTDPGFLLRRRQPNPELLSLLRKPLQHPVWLWAAVSVLAISAISAGLWGSEDLGPQPSALERFFFGAQSFFKSFWTIGMLSLQQGLPGSYTLHRRGLAQKLLFIVWLICSFLIAAVYGSKLIGILLEMKEEVVPFRDLGTLAEAMTDGDYRLIILAEEREAWDERVQRARGREELAGWVAAVRAHPPAEVPSVSALLRELEADPRLVHPYESELEMRYAVAADQRCSLRFVGSEEEVEPVALALPVGFPHREPFNRALLRLSAAPLQQSVERYLGEELCDKAEPYGDMGLGVWDVQALFWLYGLGGAAALGVLAAEWLWAIALRSYDQHRDAISRSMSRLADRLASRRPSQAFSQASVPGPLHPPPPPQGHTPPPPAQTQPLGMYQELVGAKLT